MILIFFGLWIKVTTAESLIKIIYAERGKINAERGKIPVR
jgi:hypothetical protein